MDALDKAIIHIPDEIKQCDMRFHHTIQNGLQFQTHELFISGIYHLVLLDCSFLQVTETKEGKTMDKGELMYLRYLLRSSTVDSRNTLFTSHQSFYF